jgi:hypothetical protein
MRGVPFAALPLLLMAFSTGRAQIRDQHNPGTTVKASEYGVLCNTSHDDTAPIQAAVNAANVVAGGAYVSPYPMVGGTVELPQGLCRISAPIVMNGFGSLIGSANGTWLQPLEPWPGGPMVIVRFPYGQLQGGANGEATINRYIKDINFTYGGNREAVTGIQVQNLTGTSSRTPYPAGSDVAHFQEPGIRIEGDTFLELDTAIDLEDCGECFITQNQINFVRTGIVDGGNNFAVYIDDNAIQDGSYRFTPKHDGPTVGITSFTELRWGCSNAKPNCAGGTAAQSQYVSPQGLTVSNTDVSTFDIDADIINVEGLDLHDNGFDYGGGGSQGQANPTLFLGTLNWAQIHHNLIANARGDANAINVAPAKSTPSDTDFLDGLWISDNYIQSYQADSKGSGVMFLPGAFARRNVYVTNNQFFKLSQGINVAAPLTYSVIRGNYGFAMKGPLIQLQAAGAESFFGTVIADNTTSNRVPVLSDVAGAGYTIGYNQSPAQHLGDTYGKSAGCTYAAGAIGSHCDIAVTWENPFNDRLYSAQCTLNGGEGLNVVAGYNIVDGNSIKVSEAALSATATGGGSITCSAHHP